MAAVAKLQAVLGLDPREFKAGMGKATDSARGFQSDIKKIGGLIAASFSVGAIVGFGKSVVTWASNISEAAQNAGVLTSEMMALNEVALQGGLGVDEMRSMLSKLQVELANAADGEEVSRKKFEDLGLSITELSAMNPAQMFQAVAKAAVEAGDPLTTLADIFGAKLGPKAVSALTDIAENGLPAVGTAAADAADKLESLGDRWGVVAEKMKRKAMEIAVAVSDFAESEAVRGRAEKKAFKESSFMDKMGFAGTRKAKAAGEQAVQEWWQKKYDDEKKTREEKNAGLEVAKESRIKRAAKGETVVAERKDEKQKKEEQKKADEKEEQKKADEKEKQKKADEADKVIRSKNQEKNTRRSYAEREERLREQMVSGGVRDAVPSQMNQDAMARIGGFTGGSRAGYDAASAQVSIAKNTLKVQQEIKELQAEMIEVLRSKKGELI